ncbi:phage integrase SAM-like domain-containing protein, partial [Bacteroides uniformis]|uniref:phage integrase SAM-like domain-containing protein n=1 Tax=Bacteroides uniformis TaxID=820 RepID=UPI00210CAF77
QINIGAENYIKYSGNLNNLAGPQITIREKSDSLIEYISKEIAIATVRESTRILHQGTQSLLTDFSADIKLQDVTSEYLHKLEIYMRDECELS